MVADDKLIHTVELCPVDSAVGSNMPRPRHS